MKKKPRVPKPKPFLAALSASSGPALIKHLASCSPAVRSQTLRLIQAWLQESKTLLEHDDMMKLWKGLFYCLWHSDKAAAQGSLIDRLCSFLVSLDPVLSLQYFSVCLVTLRREWAGIDHLRLDKFYLFVRRFVSALFVSMRKYGWDLEHVGRFVGVLEEKGLLANDSLSGNGVNYHVVSVYVDELKGFHVPLARKEVVGCLFRPFFGVLGRSLDKILVGKVKSFVFDALLDQGRVLLKRMKNGDEGGEGDLLLGIIALKMGFSERLYELGSSPDCVQGNRKVVIGLHEEFSKLEKQLEASGVDVEIPEYPEDVENDGEEVPQLISIRNEGDMMGGAEPVVQEKGSLKKKKKKKDKVEGAERAERAEKAEKSKKKKKTKIGVVDNCGAVIANGLENVGSSSEVSTLEDRSVVSSNGYGTGNGTKDDDILLDLSESVMSNLQAEFEKVAGEDDMESGSIELPLGAIKKKRKRAKRADSARDSEAGIQGEDRPDNGAQSSSKSAKKVRFAMKNNLVWKPHSPLPPQDLRIPPSVTPRGSALKKGVPPGPIREMVPASKKARKRKGRRILRTASPAVKRLKKVKVLSI